VRSILFAFVMCILICAFSACDYNSNSGDLSGEIKADTTAVVDDKSSDANNSDVKSTFAEETTTVDYADQSIVYRDDDVVVEKLTPREDIIIVDAIWDIPTENETISQSDVIAKAIITDIQEVAVHYTFMDTECVSYKTLATVDVTELYYSSENETVSAFVVAIPSCSYECMSDFPDLSAGNSYVFFMRNTAELDDSLKLSNYADYYIGGSSDIAAVNDESCEVNYLFGSFSDNSTLVSDSEESDLLEGEFLVDDDDNAIIYSNTYDTDNSHRYVMPFEDFENALTDKIKELT